MSFVGVTVTQVNIQQWRIFGDATLRNRINRFAQKKYQGDREGCAVAFHALCNHRGLLFLDDVSAVERDRVELAKRGNKMLAVLRQDLKRPGRVTQVYPRVGTGQWKLTWDTMARSHAQRVLPLSDEWLLFSLERHPRGGTPPFRLQHWLYHLPSCQVGRIADRWVEYGHPEGGLHEITFGLGAPDRALVDDWFQQAETLLGAAAADQLRQAIVQPNDELVATGFYDVLNRCRQITGIEPPPTAEGYIMPLPGPPGEPLELVSVLHGLVRHPVEVPGPGDDGSSASDPAESPAVQPGLSPRAD